MAGVLRAAGMEASEPPPARATIVTPTYRPNLLPRVLAQFRAQSWPDKELVVIANTEVPEAWPVDRLDPAGDEQLVFPPRSY